jgi:hypothetical protein
MPTDIAFDGLPMGYVSQYSAPGSTAEAITTKFLSSEDGERLITRLEGLPDQILTLVGGPSGLPNASSVDHMLAIVRPDATATVYINEIPISLEFVTKRSVTQGEAVADSDMADIRRMGLGSIVIPPDCGVLFLFSARWRK